MISMQVELQEGRILLSLEELEEEVRRGRLDVNGQWRPVGETDYRPLSILSSLKVASQHPDARLAAAFREPCRPWGLLTLALGMLWMSLLDPRTLAMGWEPTILDQRPWTVWTAPLTHLGPLHLLGNLPILLYCGWRVQRALGAASLAMVGAAAVAGASFLVLFWGETPVAGASILAWGFCGAQVAVGLRFGASLPEGQRGFYGIGNLVLALPLYLLGLGAQGVSHLAHLGGLLGGGLAAVLLQPESRVGGASKARRKAWNGAWALLLLLLPMLGAQFASLRPPLTTPVELAGTGVRLHLPSRMAAHPRSLHGMEAWSLSPKDDQPVFGELAWVQGGRDPLQEWSSHLRGEAHFLPAPAPRAPGWTAMAIRVEGEQPYRVVEQRLQRGDLRVRIGYVLREHASPFREEVYDQILATAEIGDPPDLEATRTAWEQSPREPSRIRAYAQELLRVGETGKAQDLLRNLTNTP